MKFLNPNGRQITLYCHHMHSEPKLAFLTFLTCLDHSDRNWDCCWWPKKLLTQFFPHKVSTQKHFSSPKLPKLTPHILRLIPIQRLGRLEDRWQKQWKTVIFTNIIEHPVNRLTCTKRIWRLPARGRRLRLRRGKRGRALGSREHSPRKRSY